MSPREFTNSLPILLQTLWLLTIIPAAGLAVLLLISTVTLSGALVGTGVLIFWLAFPWVASDRPHVRWLNRIGTAFGLVAISIALVLAPSGKSPANARLQSLYDGPASFHRWSPSQFVPEIDQHLMGSRLFTVLDPFIDARQAHGLRKSLEKIYLPMREDDEFAAVGNVMGICYHSLAFGQRHSGHRYVYVPATETRDRMPVILFLHGSLGNFKGYLWVWKQFADENGVAIVAPSFGRGEWREDGGIRSITKTFKWCQNDNRFDPDKIYLAGLSNGGAGVTLAIPEIGQQLAGLIYLSPVLESSELNQPHVLHRIESLPVLLISGSDDRRIPATALEAAVATIAGTGADIDSHFIAEEDHFLFFSQPDRVTDLISDWFRAENTPQ